MALKLKLKFLTALKNMRTNKPKNNKYSAGPELVTPLNDVKELITNKTPMKKGSILIVNTEKRLICFTNDIS